MTSSKVYYDNGRIYPYLQEDKYIFFTYDEYKNRINFLKNIASNQLQYSRESPAFKFTISHLKANTNAIITIGLCNGFGIENRKNLNQELYGQFDNATFKCPMMRDYIQEKNQKELERFIEFFEISGCNNERMCKIYNTLKTGDHSSVVNSTIVNFRHNFIIKMLNDLKDYTIKIQEPEMKKLE